MPHQDGSAGGQKAASHGLSSSFRPLGLNVPHCHIQPRHASLVAATAQELHISYLNAQKCLSHRKCSSSCRLGQAAAEGFLGSVAGAHRNACFAMGGSAAWLFEALFFHQLKEETHLPRNEVPLARRKSYGKWEGSSIMLTTISWGLC